MNNIIDICKTRNINNRNIWAICHKCQNKRCYQSTIKCNDSVYNTKLFMCGKCDKLVCEHSISKNSICVECAYNNSEIICNLCKCKKYLVFCNICDEIISKCHWKCKNDITSSFLLGVRKCHLCK